jgi:hypothetical protein
VEHAVGVACDDVGVAGERAIAAEAQRDEWPHVALVVQRRDQLSAIAQDDLPSRIVAEASRGNQALGLDADPLVQVERQAQTEGATMVGGQPARVADVASETVILVVEMDPAEHTNF